MSCQVNIVLTFLVLIIMFTRSPLASSHLQLQIMYLLLVECHFFLLLKILIFNIQPFDNIFFPSVDRFSKLRSRF